MQKISGHYQGHLASFSGWREVNDSPFQAIADCAVTGREATSTIVGAYLSGQNVQKINALKEHFQAILDTLDSIEGLDV